MGKIIQNKKILKLGIKNIKIKKNEIKQIEKVSIIIIKRMKVALHHSLS